METRHGRVTTPALLPVVNPNRPIIPPTDLANRFHAEILITNAYILGRGPHRDSVLRQGVHEFLGFSGAVMTDSGAFQSHVYGDVNVTNAEVIDFQKRIGADLGTMLDVFSEPSHDRARATRDVDETIRRAREADSLREDMVLVGAVQGGLHTDLRERCAQEVSTLGVSVCAIGGVVPLLESYRFQDLVRVILASTKGLDPSKPVHLFAAGHPLVFPLAALLGCDLFASASCGKYARAGRMLVSHGTRHAAGLRETAHRTILHRFRHRLLERYQSPPAKGLLVLPEHRRPFMEGYAPLLARVMASADVHAVVKSIWGPVPVEPDQVWPMAQSVVPDSLELESLEAADVFFREWAAGAGYPFGLLWEGDSSLEELRTRAPGNRTVDWNASRVRATADYQFGRGAAEALLRGTISYVISKNTGKVRNVVVDGDHVLSLRAEDGLFTLKAAGAQRLHGAFQAPRLRVVIESDAVPFVREGKNVFAKFVREADPELRPGDESLVVSPDDELCAVAQSSMNRRGRLAVKRGVGAHACGGVPPFPRALPH